MRWIVAFGITAAAAWAAGAQTWSFEGDEVGKAPAGFEFSTTRKTPPGRWEVVDDGGKKVLAQLDEGQEDGRFAMAVVARSSMKDLRLSVRGKAIKGTQDQAAGLVWRYKDADNYYLARWNALEANVRLYRVVNGNRIKFAGKEGVELKADTWYTLGIEQHGQHIAVSLDGKTLFEADDKTFAEAGQVGVWIKADSVTWFDDLSAEELK